jgi:hypothetical protein
VSIAQYVRDSAVARLALAEGSERGREQPELPATLAASGEPVRLAHRIGAQVNSAEAVRAQGRLARDRAKRLRIEADVLRKQTSSRNP